MMEKLIIDTLVSYREYYKIDAFRFDLMGHHTLENMKKIKEIWAATSIFTAKVGTLAK